MSDSIAKTLGVEPLLTGDIEDLFVGGSDTSTELTAINSKNDNDEDIIESYEPSQELINADADAELERDIDYAKSNIKKIIIKGHSAVDELFSLARESEKHQTYGAAASLIKTLTDMNKAFIDLSIKKHNIKTGKKPDGETESLPKDNGKTEVKNITQINNITNNSNNFVGTLDDILDKNKNITENEIKDVDNEEI